MKKTVVLVSLLFNSYLHGQTPSNDPHWQLLWEDNFNSFDANKWLKVDWAQHGEPQLYLANSVTVSNGNLVIKVNNNPTYCPPNPPTVWGACWPCANQWYNYTSGWVETKQAYNTQYGYIESRIKLPYGYGFFPAFWTFIGSGVNGSNAAEIDVFEMLGGDLNTNSLYNTPNIMTTNLHTEYPDIVDKFKSLIPTGFDYTSYHNYGIEWAPSKIIWYVDGYPVRLFTDHGIVDPVRIILNLAIRPNLFPNSSTPFPSNMLVDYVKVYDLKNDCSSIINTCNYNFSTYDNKVKKEIIIGGSACVNSIPNNTNMYLRATDGVLIKGDFTVPVGSELYIDVNPCN